MILADANVLVYAINTRAPQHRASRAFIEAVREKQVDGILVPQVLLEFFAIVTDPRRIDQPLGAEEAWEQVKLLKMIFPIRDESLKALGNLMDAITEGMVKGGGIFDAFLVAQMRACGISLICTYNIRDFKSYKGVVAHTPESLGFQPDNV